jgi:hypothetical protein
MVTWAHESPGLGDGFISYSSIYLCESPMLSNQLCSKRTSNTLSQRALAKTARVLETNQRSAWCEVIQLDDP